MESPALHPSQKKKKENKTESCIFYVSTLEKKIEIKMSGSGNDSHLHGGRQHRINLIIQAVLHTICRSSDRINGQKTLPRADNKNSSINFRRKEF